MDLKEFVSNSLNEIISAVVLSQRYCSDQNIHAQVAPTDITTTSATLAHTKVQQVNGVSRIVTDVAFDIAVTASDEQSARGGAGIKVVGIDLRIGVDAEKSATSSAVSRISFTVPIIFPEAEQSKAARLR